MARIDTATNRTANTVNSADATAYTNMAKYTSKRNSLKASAAAKIANKGMPILITPPLSASSTKRGNNIVVVVVIVVVVFERTSLSQVLCLVFEVRILFQSSVNVCFGSFGAGEEENNAAVSFLPSWWNSNSATNEFFFQ